MITSLFVWLTGFNFEIPAGVGALHPGPLPQCGCGGGISDAKGEDLPG